ncbi:MAG: aminodeoxychorismate/anthranilate synthase component II [Gemmataceae bacterium]|nr:aminodeoxychorismate/anthranilate synthase component II [Gemmataceae bacterium]
MILLIDNYDSFTWNLVQRIGTIDPDREFRVVRNDAVTTDDIARLNPSHLVISPGPKSPAEAGISCAVIERFAPAIPILGVCLGHQCIGQVFGGRVVRSPHVMHGKTSEIFHNSQGIFAGLPDPFTATRYHSLVIERSSWHHPDFAVTAWTSDDVIMGLQHVRWPLFGVQFHPESFLTTEGPRLLRNFLGVRAY